MLFKSHSNFDNFVLQKSNTMNLALEIKKIQKDLEQLKDENLINSIKSLLNFAKKQNSNAVFQKMSVAEYKKRAEQSEEDIKLGRYTNIDDL